MTSYTAFTEGWALYAENPLIAYDTDTYEGQPLYKYGMLKSQVGKKKPVCLLHKLHKSFFLKFIIKTLTLLPCQSPSVTVLSVFGIPRQQAKTKSVHCVRHREFEKNFYNLVKVSTNEIAGVVMYSKQFFCCYFLCLFCFVCVRFLFLTSLGFLFSCIFVIAALARIAHDRGHRLTLQGAQKRRCS